MIGTVIQIPSVRALNWACIWWLLSESGNIPVKICQLSNRSMLLLAYRSEKALVLGDPCVAMVAMTPWGSHHDKDQMDYVTKEHTDKVEEHPSSEKCWYPWDGILDNQPIQIHTPYIVGIYWVYPLFLKGSPKNLCFSNATLVTSDSPDFFGFWSLKRRLDGFWHRFDMSSLLSYTCYDFYPIMALQPFVCLGLAVAESCLPPNTGT